MPTRAFSTTLTSIRELFSSGFSCFLSFLEYQCFALLTRHDDSSFLFVSFRFNDLQAEDRCHRIGQTKPVTVYKMVTEDTVDAAIHDMQEQKKKMNAAIIGDGGESAKEQKKQDAKAVHSMVQSAVSRFFATSPEAKGKKKKHHGADISDSDDFL